jgi:hypothetical protein
MPVRVDLPDGGWWVAVTPEESARHAAATKRSHEEFARRRAAACAGTPEGDGAWCPAGPAEPAPPAVERDHVVAGIRAAIRGLTSLARWQSHPALRD